MRVCRPSRAEEIVQVGQEETVHVGHVCVAVRSTEETVHVGHVCVAVRLT